MHLRTLSSEGNGNEAALSVMGIAPLLSVQDRVLPGASEVSASVGDQIARSVKCESLGTSTIGLLETLDGQALWSERLTNDGFGRYPSVGGIDGTQRRVMRSMDFIRIYHTENSSAVAKWISASSRQAPKLQGFTSGQASFPLFPVSVTSTHMSLARFVQISSLHSFHVFVPGRKPSLPPESGGWTRVVSRGKYFVDNGKLGSHSAVVKVALKNGFSEPPLGVSG